MKEKAIIKSLINETKKARIKEFGLEGIIEAERQKYAAEIKIRKHDMMPYMREMNSIVQLIKHYAQNNDKNLVKSMLKLA